MNKYSEDPETISLYPIELYDEDLTPDIDVEIDERCTEIYEATKGWGTSNGRLVEALGSTTGHDRKLISLQYPKLHDEYKSLKNLMQAECGDSSFGEALQYLALGPVEAECRMLKKAVDGLGSDKVMLYSILCGRSNEDMELLKKTYFKEYTDDLVSRMGGEVGGDMKKILISCVQVSFQCNLQFATCNLQHATCNMQLATCNLQHATCNMQYRYSIDSCSIF